MSMALARAAHVFTFRHFFVPFHTLSEKLTKKKSKKLSPLLVIDGVEILDGKLD